VRQDSIEICREDKRHISSPPYVDVDVHAAQCSKQSLLLSAASHFSEQQMDRAAG